MFFQSFAKRGKGKVVNKLSTIFHKKIKYAKSFEISVL